MKYADIKFNGGNGTVLCNCCQTMLVDHCNVKEQIDCIHLCNNCYERYTQLDHFVLSIANDWVESSHDKIKVQRDDYIKRAKELSFTRLKAMDELVRLSQELGLYDT